MRSKSSKGPQLRQAQANLNKQVAAGLDPAAAAAEMSRLSGMKTSQIAAGNAAAARPVLAPPLPPPPPSMASPSPRPPDMEQFPTRTPMMPFPPRGQDKTQTGMSEQPLMIPQNSMNTMGGGAPTPPDPAMIARLSEALGMGPAAGGRPPMGPGSQSAWGPQQQNSLNSGGPQLNPFGPSSYNGQPMAPGGFGNQLQRPNGGPSMGPGSASAWGPGGGMGGMFGGMGNGGFGNQMNKPTKFGF